MRGIFALLRRWLGAERASVVPQRWVVVDTETSGLSPERDRLLAIGAVAVDDGGIQVGDSFEVIVQGGPSGDAENIAVHGIGYGEQGAGTPVREALAAFARWAADAPAVAFHADFDRTVLRVASERAGLEGGDRPWLDLAPLAAVLVPDAPRPGGRTLDDWLEAFGIECAVRHNAAADALAAAELLLRLRDIAAKQRLVGFNALVRTAGMQKWLGNAR